MKKLAIALLVAGGIYYYFNRKKTDENTPEDEQPQGLLEDIWVKYNNYQLSDKDGYWFVIKDGKIYNAASDASFYAWQTKNPGRFYPTPAPESIWSLYANTDRYGGTY